MQQISVIIASTATDEDTFIDQCKQFVRAVGKFQRISRGVTRHMETQARYWRDTHTGSTPCKEFVRQCKRARGS